MYIQIFIWKDLLSIYFTHLLELSRWIPKNGWTMHSAPLICITLYIKRALPSVILYWWWLCFSIFVFCVVKTASCKVIWTRPSRQSAIRTTQPAPCRGCPGASQNGCWPWARNTLYRNEICKRSITRLCSRCWRKQCGYRSLIRWKCCECCWTRRPQTWWRSCRNVGGTKWNLWRRSTKTKTRSEGTIEYNFLLDRILYICVEYSYCKKKLWYSILSEQAYFRKERVLDIIFIIN